MRAIHRKLLRDLWRMSGAVLTIALVLAAGVAAFVTLTGTYDSLVDTRDLYYRTQRFGDVFAHLERAPLTLVARIEALPGVDSVYPRLVGDARVPLPDLDEPAQAHVVSLPASGDPPLNGVQIVRGRMPHPERTDEALLLEIFAQRHAIEPGQTLVAIVEGRERMVRVVGIAMSPEYVLAVPNGSTAPAPERFAVLWMPRPGVEAAYDLKGAFNDVVIRTQRGADREAVARALDAILDPYGGLPAVSRKRQISEYYLSQDLAQLANIATIAPGIFLAVAAFLLNVVMSRLVDLDRPQVATLKAVGYTNREVGLHYGQFALLISAIGASLGLVVGTYLGHGMTDLYVEFYRMPDLDYRMDASLLLRAVCVSLGAGLLGVALSVRRVIGLPPAEAMRPAAPPSYRRGAFVSRLVHLLDPSSRMVARELLRRPVRTALSALGIAAATGIIVVGQFFNDAMAYLVDDYMQAQQRETLAVLFVRPVPEAAVRALGTLPGVRDVQWEISRQVRVRAGQHERVVILAGHAERHSMRPLLDERAEELALNADDVLCTKTLADVLQVRPGDSVRIEPLVGDRTPRSLRLTGTISELMGLWIHVPAARFQALLREAPSAGSALLNVDRDEIATVTEKLSEMPNVMSVTRKAKAIEEFRSQSGATMRTFSLVLTLFAITIAVSVVYNNARVALSLRSRELASLRVLGFTRAEISSILIGELFAQVLVGIPIGLLFGKGLVRLMMSANDPEVFRFPLAISARTFSVAALVTLTAALMSALLVRRKLDKLDLVEVLKTRE